MRSRPAKLEDVDLDLERYIEELRRHHKRLDHGRVILVVSKHDRVTTGGDVRTDAMTEEDIDRVMREKPGWDE